ncbi:RNA 2',3'-cyclic phosphodiesterase [Botrimarina hoheduenensis]|uniref:RNA 2',3'-cyclic phosphodiesterase n=1 Tax=Botrimarina hoheduenensis TaxID=2528000 RepID=A0A5C5WG65_9BACT|nr:RNA 2',3'-cyclic phosphodiesterase [Botrimarina hoheduenensis]TWT48772.1 2',5' RNA ligase family [Botrimarina hoheduenensis]
MSKTRTFIAIETEQDQTSRALALIDRLRPLAPRARWVEEEQLHLTLLFLGDLDDREVVDACKHTEWTAAATPRFTLRLSGVGAFPDVHSPKALWLGVTEGADILHRLHDDLLADVGHLQTSRERSQFVPHLTLARLSRGGGISPHLPATLTGLADYDAGVTRVRRLTVFASELSSAGPEYYPLAQCRLA